MRQEKELGTRGSKLTSEQREIRCLIRGRRRGHRARMAKAATDEEYRHKLEKKEAKGQRRQVSRKSLLHLTAEQRNCRFKAQQQRRCQRIWGAAWESAQRGPIATEVETTPTITEEQLDSCYEPSALPPQQHTSGVSPVDTRGLRP